MPRKIYHEIDESPRRSPLESYHEFLSEGADLKASRSRLFSFFENYRLVRYGRLEIVEKSSLPASHADFPARLEESMEVNRRKVRSFIRELEQEGVESLTQLEELPQGYQSKTLHTLTHLLDGFFGIDSHFYNLLEGSHWVSPELREKIAANPDNYMLLAVRAST